jgi:cobalamin-dependent methionine synthase I
MVAESGTLVEPRACYAIKDLGEPRASGPFRGAESIAFSVSTIGPSLEARVAELAERGETLRALVLDAIGSASVEAVTDVVNALICERVGQKERRTSRRISPGYAGWPIEGQAEVFELLPTRVSGVTLMSTWFMEPRKSISAAIAIGHGVTHSKYVAICAYCNLRGCAFRRAQDPEHPEPTHG